MKNLKSPERKQDVMNIHGCLGLYSCYIRTLHEDNETFYDFIRTRLLSTGHTNTTINQRQKFCGDTILAVHYPEYPFLIHVDSSNVGTGCIQIQHFPEGKRIISFNSVTFDKAEQKMSTMHRKLCRTVSGLQTYEHYIIGSPFPRYLHCDHKPIPNLSGRKGQLLHRLFRYQVIKIKF